ncbi:transcriptional regulator [Rhodobacteraceae bacterium WD3A24]|nr:transcriptional regulator [Rhodobacteraceae bacterium WD3A24]
MTEHGSEDWFSPEAATFGDRLAGAREAAGLTQAELAKRLGVKLKTVIGWEQDLSEPRANKLQMLAGLLSVSMTWLLTGEGEGIDAPVGEAEVAADARALMTEMRQMRNDMTRMSERLGVLEKRFRGLMKDAL